MAPAWTAVVAATLFTLAVACAALSTPFFEAVESEALVRAAPADGWLNGGSWADLDGDGDVDFALPGNPAGGATVQWVENIGKGRDFAMRELEVEPTDEDDAPVSGTGGPLSGCSPALWGPLLVHRAASLHDLRRSDVLGDDVRHESALNRGTLTACRQSYRAGPEGLAVGCTSPPRESLEWRALALGRFVVARLLKCLSGMTACGWGNGCGEVSASKVKIAPKAQNSANGVLIANPLPRISLLTDGNDSRA